MRLTHLSLTNFRNYARLELDLPPGNSLLVGDNAQGKSNLLEAISFLATARSFRAAMERELIHWLALGDPQPFARLVATVEKKAGPLKAEVVLVGEGQRGGGIEVRESRGAEDQGERGTWNVENGTHLDLSKRLKLNGTPKRAADYIGQINVVSFSPEDLELIGGPPGMRRRYLDVLLAQVDARYYRALARYNKVLVQRNHLLRQIAARQDDPAQLDFWNDELVSNGSYLAMERQKAVQDLNGRAAEIHRELTGGTERLQVIYRPSVAAGEGEIAASFREGLQRLHQRELHQGVSLLGPHRDDLGFLVDGVDMHIYGSRGQQRTIALSLKLAELGAVRSLVGEEPILLLDDIMSELDPDRRRWLLAAIAPGQQAILTATETEHFTAEFLTQATVFQVKAATVRPINGSTN